MTLAGTTLTAAGPLTGARIAGVGAARPHTVISGTALTERFGKSADWLKARTGIAQLRRLGTEESLLDLAHEAAKAAIEDAGLQPADIDALLVASCSSGIRAGAPNLSEQLAGRLCPDAVAFDLNSACAGFSYALGTAGDLIGNHQARTVLIVGAERMSSLIDPADLGTSILFGDGAGAMVVIASDEQEIGPTAWSSDGSMAGVLEVPAGETALSMQGQKVFRWAVDEVHKVAADAMAKAGVVASDIEVFIPHQANLRIVEAISNKLGLGHAATATDVVDAGNTSAASIPMALAKLRQTGQTRRGQLALLAGFGAGLSIAAQVVRLP